MEAIEQLKIDFLEGRIDANRLVDLIVASQQQLQASQQRIAELEKQLAGLRNGQSRRTVIARLTEPSWA